MITMTTFGNNGRLANQLFQYASLIGLSEKHKTKLILPSWKYSKYFNGKFPVSNRKQLTAIHGIINEKNFNYDEYPEIETNDEIVQDIHGYFQSKKYWEHCKDLINEKLTFKTKFKNEIKEKHKRIFEKFVIAVHIRRGDYVDNSNYYQLPISYYINALEQYNLNLYNILFFSDDIEYCKIHFQCLPNAYFSEGNSDIEDLCLGSLCSYHIIGNSTFGWWMAYLSNSITSNRTIRPNEHFTGKLLNNNIKDYYLQNWIVIDVNKKIDLSDVTFTIPVSCDHPDRLENLEICINYLTKYFNTNIIVMEQGGDKFEYLASNKVKYVKFESKVFHRTKMLNEMAKLSHTNIIVNQDCDVIIPPMQILKAVKHIRSGIDVVSPFDGRFWGIDRKEYFKKFEKCLDTGILKNYRPKGNFLGNKFDCVGGCIFFDKASFFKGGMENENFISWGAEDVERFIRFKKLDFKLIRLTGVLYHIDHYVGINSGESNPYFQSNEVEVTKIKRMSKQELTNYINKWTWTTRSLIIK